MLVSNGNHKIGSDTLILNMTSATDCPSKVLGLCKLGKKCYAMKAERQYPQILPYRRAQEEYWGHSTAEEIAKDLGAEIKKHKKTPIKFIRVSEAGDFRSQLDVEKLSKVADLVWSEPNSAKFYVYTARKDLDFSKISPNLVVNGSGFVVNNSFTAVPKKGIEKYSTICPGNCRGCDLCKSAAGLQIKVRIH